MASLVSTFRLGVLTGHLRPLGAAPDRCESDARTLVSQDCAAHCTLVHARPAAPTDCAFARPVQQAPSCAELEAAAAAAAVLRADAAPGPAAPLAQPSDASIPLFARPEAPKAAATGAAGPRRAPAPSPRPPVSASGHWAPQASVLESEFGYVLQVAMPGVEAADVRAELLPGGRLAVAGVRRARVAGGAGPLPDLMAALPEVFGVSPGGGGGAWVVAGPGDVLATGRFRLVWQIPEDANQDSLRADFKDGCLLVHVTKKSVLSLF